MRTTILINSRGRPEQLTSTCMYLANTCSDLTNTKFCIRADIDDPETIVAASKLRNYMPIALSYGGRPVSMGLEHNRMAAANPADVYLILNDDLYPSPILKSEPDENGKIDVTMSWWDKYIEMVLDNDDPNRPNVGIYCWNLIGAGTGDYPIIPAKWYNAAGRIFPEHFPFWWDDQTLMAEHVMVYGLSFARLESLLLHAPKSFVSRMRDIKVWTEFYQAKWDERVEQASKIRASMGMDPMVPLSYLAHVREYECGFHSKLAMREKFLQDTRPPDQSYLLALERAINFIQARKLAKLPTFYPEFKGFEEEEPELNLEAAE